MKETTSIATEARELDTLAHQIDRREDEFRVKFNDFLGKADPSNEVVAERLETVFHSRISFDGNEIENLDHDIALFAVVRELIARHKLVIHKHRYPNWADFVSQFKQAIFV